MVYIFSHVHVFVTKHGKDYGVIAGPDGDDYHLVVNTFRKQYNLPYYNYADKNKKKEKYTICPNTTKLRLKIDLEWNNVSACIN